jgi:ribose-phosphate pyrophosphokinase
MAKKFDAVIFGLDNSIELTKEICKMIGTTPGKVNKTQFADGEILLQAGKSVRGRHTYIVQSTSAPVNETYMELFILIDALKRASAKSINVVMPYYGYSRQDRKADGRQPITAKLMASLLETSGATRVITFDLHSPQLQGFFSIPCDDLRALPTIAKHIKSKKMKDIIIVSPDHGGSQRARKLAEMLGKDIPVAIVDKRRTGANKTEVMNLIGDVKGKNAILIDDMIDTAGTIVKGAEAVKGNGAKSVIVACTHPVFSGPAIERLSTNKAIKTVIATNTIQLTKEKKFPKLEVVSIAPFIAGVINAIETHTSISAVYKKHGRK